MSIIPPGLSRHLQFYLSGPLPCPYLPAQVERKLFTRLEDTDADLNAEINATLCRAGFRRSHNVVYRPACNGCNACIPVRIPVKLFNLTQSFRRILRRNADLYWSRVEAEPTAEMFTLFTAYQQSRHGDSDMARMNASEFSAMLQEGRADTHIYQLRSFAGVLKGCIIADHVGDGISAVYSFYNPDEASRSLGTQMILSLISEARARGWSFVYLGYWIAASRKMAYKSRFKPLQQLGPQGWDWIEKEEI